MNYENKNKKEKERKKMKFILIFLISCASLLATPSILETPGQNYFVYRIGDFLHCKKVNLISPFGKTTKDDINFKRIFNDLEKRAIKNCPGKIKIGEKIKTFPQLHEEAPKKSPTINTRLAKKIKTLNDENRLLQEQLTASEEETDQCRANPCTELKLASERDDLCTGACPPVIITKTVKKIVKEKCDDGDSTGDGSSNGRGTTTTTTESVVSGGYPSPQEIDDQQNDTTNYDNGHIVNGVGTELNK